MNLTAAGQGAFTEGPCGDRAPSGATGNTAMLAESPLATGINRASGEKQRLRGPPSSAFRCLPGLNSEPLLLHVLVVAEFLRRA